MGAQKKCNLLVKAFIFSIFVIFYFYILILNIYETYKIKERAKDKTISWLLLLLSLLFLSIPVISIIYGFKYDIKFILIYKKKNSEINKNGNGTNNINNEEEYFIKQTEYKFKNTVIKKRFSNKKEFHKKIVSCVSILSDGKIIFGFVEGTILVCTLDENNCELKQNFSFNKYKLRKIIYICESIENEGEIMVSVDEYFLPIKIIKLNLNYKYSLIKELARDKPYIIYQEMNKINNDNLNNNINNNNEDNCVFKILSFEKDKFLLCGKKGLLIKEKVRDLNSDEYINSREYHLNNEVNEIIHDLIKINEEYFATLETKEDKANIYFYTLNNLTKENKYIEDVISAENKSNRLCFINESLISVIDDNSILFIDIISKEKIKTIDLENIMEIGIDSFYDGGIIFLQKRSFNTINNRLFVPFIVKIKKNQGNSEYNPLSFTDTSKDCKEETRKIKYCNSQIKFIKCLKNNGIVLLGNDEGKLFIWEEIDINKSHNNSINTIII